jgi:DNA-binding GntR family transcriptional regulator
MILKKGIPRHTQITQWLIEQIEQGEFNPDEKLPSEMNWPKSLMSAVSRSGVPCSRSKMNR